MYARVMYRQGFTILEVLVAVLVVSVAAAGVAQLTVMSGRASLAARERSGATVLAAQKLEELRSLRWTYRDAGGAVVPLSDVTTDLSADPETGAGAGLRPSPGRSLEVSAPGYVDYVGADGSWVGTGAVPTPGTVFVRRWSIAPLPADPADSVVLQVRVTTLRQEATAARDTPPGSLPNEAWLITVLTRKGS